MTESKASGQMAAPAFTLEGLLTSPAAFGLSTASPLQRAICRVADGLPLGDLATHPDVVSAIGDVTALPSTPPLELYLLSGIRTGKSLLAAALAVRAALTCDLGRIRPGEPVRVSVVSLTVDLARVVFEHITGTLEAKPALRALLEGSPTSDTVNIRHPSGHVIEVRVVAGARAGASLVARWSAGVIFDEAPRMLGEEDGVVNFDDARRAALGRLLPGAQLVAIGSPWAPRGPIYEAVQEHWRKPSAQLVIVRAPAPAMFPIWWTAARVEQLKKQDEQTYRTDVLGEFADPESSLISSDEIDRASTRIIFIVPKQPGHSYIAAMDPGTRSNAWTLVIACRTHTGICIVLCKQWQGSKLAPLRPEIVMGEIAQTIAQYDVRHVHTDQWSADALAAIGRQDRTVTIDGRPVPWVVNVISQSVSASSKVEMYESFRTRLAGGEIELPPDPQVRADLLSIRKRVTLNGIAIELPRTADGRHADYAPAIVLVVERTAWQPKPLTMAQIDHETRDAARVVSLEEKAFGGDLRACPQCRGAGCSTCADLGVRRRPERSREASYRDPLFRGKGTDRARRRYG